MLLFALAVAQPETHDPPVQLAPGVTLTLGIGQTSVLAGMEHHAKGEFAKAAAAFRTAAEQGNVDGMRNLGNLYETGSTGDGNPADFTQAMACSR